MLVRCVTVGAALTMTSSQHLQSGSEAVYESYNHPPVGTFVRSRCAIKLGEGRREVTDGLTLRLSCLAPWKV